MILSTRIFTRSPSTIPAASPGPVLAAGAASGDANFTAFCERVRNARIAHNPSLENRTTYVCAQDYAEHIPPADYISVNLETCLAFNPGWEGSKIETPSQWAGPLVGFLLPSLGFIISIPRGWNIPASTGNIGVVTFVLVLDTLVGIGIVFGWAGPYIAGALHESFVDWGVLGQVNKIIDERRALDLRASESEWFALAITLAGSFDANAQEHQYQQTFASKVVNELEQPQTARTFLRRLCTQLVPFSIQVGVPLVFYVGASIYALVDAQARLGENDTAHSIAFGLWYHTIVLVAIASSMVLSVGSSKVIEPVLARDNFTENGYKLRCICERRLELWRWSQVRIRDPQGQMVRLDGRYRDIFDGRYVGRSCALAIFILIIPWALAFSVSYLTPLIGISCRSATVLAYACCQSFLVILWSVDTSPKAREARDNAWKRRQWKAFLGLWTITGLYHLVGIISLCVTIAGTVMQLLGVYRNCVCKAGLYYGLPTTRDRSGAIVKLSTDTQRDRDVASDWKVLGGSGVGWLIVLCLVAGWLRVRMRQRCLDLIELVAR
ncbi:hypothetical protein DL767_004501 [Monosporascus sp. MG133]|nr:hypothetical protein DL767_004501 [Monosporascus sp. MG133]